jgi:hypothetical protein
MPSTQHGDMQAKMSMNMLEKYKKEDKYDTLSFSLIIH